MEILDDGRGMLVSSGRRTVCAFSMEFVAAVGWWLFAFEEVAMEMLQGK